MIDFFVSYAGPDQAWAEWIAWKLEAIGHSTVLQAWDFTPGSNFVVEMQRAASSAARTIAILSPDYIERVFPLSEWAAAFAIDPAGLSRRLVPVRVRSCSPPGLLGQIVCLNLVGVSEREADLAMQRTFGVQGSVARAKPEKAPDYPGSGRGTIESKYPGMTTDSSGRCCGLVHAAVSAGGLLDFSGVRPPYIGSLDPTLPQVNVPNTIFVFLWFPPAEYLRQREIQPLTPCAALCTPDHVAFASLFRSMLGDMEASILGYPPPKLRLSEKRAAFDAVEAAIRSSLIASVGIPAVMLGSRIKKLDVAYQTMCELLLRPIVEAHKQYGVNRIVTRLNASGVSTANTIKFAKQVVGTAFPTKRYSVDVVAEDRIGNAMSTAARLVAWAVGQHYNSGNGAWLAKLERVTQANDAYSPHMEEYASE